MFCLSFHNQFSLNYLALIALKITTLSLNSKTLSGKSCVVHKLSSYCMDRIVQQCPALRNLTRLSNF